MMIGVILVLCLGDTATPFGALISQNGPYPLALALVTFWTVLVLTSMAAIAIFNAAMAV
jgi:hypothetical protein